MEESLIRLRYPVRFLASSTRWEFWAGAPAGFDRAWRGPNARYASNPRIGRIPAFLACS